MDYISLKTTLSIINGQIMITFGQKIRNVNELFIQRKMCHLSVRPQHKQKQQIEKHHYLVMSYASDLSKKRRLESVKSCRIIHNEALKQNVFNITHTQENPPCAFNAPSTNYTGISRRSHLPCKDQGYMNLKII